VRGVLDGVIGGRPVAGRGAKKERDLCRDEVQQVYKTLTADAYYYLLHERLQRCRGCHAGVFIGWIVQCAILEAVTFDPVYHTYTRT